MLNDRNFRFLKLDLNYEFNIIINYARDLGGYTNSLVEK